MERTRFPLAIAAIGTALALSTPTYADSCTDPLDRVVANYAANGNAPVMLSDAEVGSAMEEYALGEVSRGFYVVIDAQMYLGLEVNGCLLPPIAVHHPLRATRLSGTTPFGVFA